MSPTLAIGTMSFPVWIPFFLTYCLVIWIVLRRRAGALRLASRPETARLMCSVFLLSWGGAKLFHLLFATDAPLGWPWLWELAQVNGRVYYGSLAGAAAGVTLWNWNRTQGETRELWNTGAELAAFGYGLLRLDCFAEGCCWGRMTTSPLAVVFHRADSAMPLLGVPVHPVQLYEAALGFSILGLLRLLRSRGYNLIIVYFFSLATGRFFLEILRGDEVRVGGAWSTAQVFSVAIVGCILLASILTRLPIKFPSPRTEPQRI